MLACIASNVAGVERFTVPVTVNVPPKWVLQPSDSSVQSGEDLSLHCQADGYPKPSHTWQRSVKGNSNNSCNYNSPTLFLTK